MDFHSRCLRKSDTELSMDDTGPLHDQYPRQWAVLVNKSYQGLAEVWVCIDCN